MSKRVKFEDQPETLHKDLEPEAYSSDDDVEVAARLEHAFSQPSGELRVRKWFSNQPAAHSNFSEAVRPVASTELLEAETALPRQEVCPRDMAFEAFLSQSSIPEILASSAYWKLTPDQKRRLKPLDMHFAAFVETKTTDDDLDRLLAQNGFRKIPCHPKRQGLIYNAYADANFAVVAIRHDGLFRHYIVRALQ